MCLPDISQSTPTTTVSHMVLATIPLFKWHSNFQIIKRNIPHISPADLNSKSYMNGRLPHMCSSLPAHRYFIALQTRVKSLSKERKLIISLSWGETFYKKNKLTCAIHLFPTNPLLSKNEFCIIWLECSAPI